MQVLVYTIHFGGKSNEYNESADPRPENGLTYTLHGDYYLLDLKLPDTDKTTIGRYDRMRMSYLQENRPGLHTRLLLSGKLCVHLAEIDRTCQERMSRTIVSAQ